MGDWMWVAALALLWLLHRLMTRGKRRAARTQREMEEYLQSITLQRRLADVLPTEDRARPARQTKTGEDWEDCAPYPECFEEEDDADL